MYRLCKESSIWLTKLSIYSKRAIGSDPFGVRIRRKESGRIHLNCPPSWPSAAYDIMERKPPGCADLPCSNRWPVPNL